MRLSLCGYDRVVNTQLQGAERARGIAEKTLHRASKCMHRHSESQITNILQVDTWVQQSTN